MYDNLSSKSPNASIANYAIIVTAKLQKDPAGRPILELKKREQQNLKVFNSI